MQKFIKNTFLFLILIPLMNFSQVYSQENSNDEYSKDYNNKPAGNWKSRIFTGGNLGLQFGNATFIEISPLVGYRITERLAAGIGITYEYLSYKDYNISTNVYGGRVFCRFYITDELFAHAEYEVLNMQPYLVGARANVESFLVGGGYRQSIGERTSLNVLILWNLNETEFSPYINPIIRIGFGIGL
jgi:hypothetical protein